MKKTKPFFDDRGVRRCPECGFIITAEEFKEHPQMVYCKKRLTKEGNSYCSDHVRYRRRHLRRMVNKKGYRQRIIETGRAFRRSAVERGLCIRCGAKNYDKAFKKCAKCADYSNIF